MLSRVQNEQIKNVSFKEIQYMIVLETIPVNIYLARDHSIIRIMRKKRGF
jgi:hypothetical protein